jgi:hypothetical protein
MVIELKGLLVVSEDELSHRIRKLPDDSHIL